MPRRSPRVGPLVRAQRRVASGAELVWRAPLAAAAGLCVGAGVAAAAGRAGSASSLVLVAAVLAVVGVALGLLALPALATLDLRDQSHDDGAPRPHDHPDMENTR